MGEVIYYDFRYEARRRELAEIQERALARLNYFSEHGTLTEEQRKQSQDDNMLLTTLQLEARTYGDLEFLEDLEY